MAVAIRMPKMSDTMTEGVIAEWLKKVGDTVKAGDILAEVETDKATMELENYEDGTLLFIGIEKGQAVPVDGIIAVVGSPGEAFEHLLSDSAPAPVVAAAGRRRGGATTAAATVAVAATPVEAAATTPTATATTPVAAPDAAQPAGRRRRPVA